MVSRKHLGALLLLILAPLFLLAQTDFKMTDEVPFNPAVKTGKLKNGIPYYIMQNSKPAKRVELILTVNAGAVLEDDDQDGLAHFCEHMAFNGTKLFPKQELVKFLESTGVRFGADLNAYTNQDETVYMITAPLENAQSLIKAVQVIRDWAGWVNYDDDDINEERGVVTEEWRLGKGATDRVTKIHADAIYFGSKYAKRNVIGDTNVLLHAPPENLRRFYKRWYNPENMAVIAVGDVDPSVFEEILVKYFVLPPGAGASYEKRPQIILPNHKDTKVSIATDPELQAASAELYIKYPADTVVTYGDWKEQIANRLAQAMLNTRLGELSRKAKPAFAGAMFGTYPVVRETHATYGRVIASDKNVLKALNALLTEVERASKHGFTETELERAKVALLANMESYYNERNKTESQPLAMELSRHVLTREQVTGIVHEFEVYQTLVPQITAEDCSKKLVELTGPDNRVITISIPDGNGYTKPTEKQVLDLVAAVSAKPIEAYVDNVPTKPLMAVEPTAGSITKTEELKEVDAKKYTLSNGAVVYVKKTDFKDDEILFSASSYGGQSLGAEADHYTLQNAASMVDESGISEFDATMLQKMLQGKNVGISPSIGMETEGFRGSASPKDLKTMMELLHLYFVSPRIDPDAVSSYKSKLEVGLENKSKSPESNFFDTVRVVLSNHHPRAIPISKADLAKIDADKALAFYKERFANAADFKFYFVGNFEPELLEAYIKTYIASLPGKPSKETWKDVGMKSARGKITKTVYSGSEPKSFVFLAIGGDAKYTPQSRFDMLALTEVMSIRLREQMREEKSGVYFVSVQPQIEKIPHEEYAVMVIFSCNPDRADELIDVVEKEIDYMKNNEVDQSYIDKVKQIQSNEREVAKKTNGFWLRGLSSAMQDNEPLSVLLLRDELISKLSAAQVKKSANTYLKMDNYAKMILKPEQK